MKIRSPRLSVVLVHAIIGSTLMTSAKSSTADICQTQVQSVFPDASGQGTITQTNTVGILLTCSSQCLDPCPTTTCGPSPPQGEEYMSSKTQSGDFSVGLNALFKLILGSAKKSQTETSTIKRTNSISPITVSVPRGRHREVWLSRTTTSQGESRQSNNQSGSRGISPESVVLGIIDSGSLGRNQSYDPCTGIIRGMDEPCPPPPNP